MNKIKETIQSDFLAAMKNKDLLKKNALGIVKSKITETEKAKGNTELTDEEVTKVIMSIAKQRRQSIEEFKNAGRQDLVEKESSELSLLEHYLPKQMGREAIVIEVKSILERIDAGGNKQRLIGQAIGAFNKKFAGQADIKLVKEIVENLA